MKKYYLPLFTALTIFAGSPSLYGNILATATYTDSVVSPGVFQYDLTLTNTGTTSIGTFWFSWIPGAGFMSATPTAVMNPTGWTDILTNANSAIQWKTSSNLMNPGDMVTGFQFDSTMTPAQMAGNFAGPGLGAGDPITTSFVYIAAPLADPGFQLTATATTPEPSTTLSAALGFALIAGGAMILRKRKPAVR